MIFSSLPRSEWEPWEPTSLVLCGGTSNLPGIETLVKETLGIKVRIGKPKNLPEGAKILDNPAYATGVGLLLWGNRYGRTTVTSTENVLRRFFFQLRRFRLPRIRISFSS
jgi:cell division protein FtsA